MKVFLSFCFCKIDTKTYLDKKKKKQIDYYLIIDNGYRNNTSK